MDKERHHAALLAVLGDNADFPERPNAGEVAGKRGNPLFKPRITKLVGVSCLTRRHDARTHGLGQRDAPPGLPRGCGWDSPAPGWLMSPEKYGQQQVGLHQAPGEDTGPAGCRRGPPIRRVWFRAPQSSPSARGTVYEATSGRGRLGSEEAMPAVALAAPRPPAARSVGFQHRLPELPALAVPIPPPSLRRPRRPGLLKPTPPRRSAISLNQPFGIMDGFEPPTQSIKPPLKTTPQHHRTPGMLPTASSAGCAPARAPIRTCPRC